MFKDDDITHVEGEVDPVRDIQIINDELRLKDLQAIEKPMQEMEKCKIFNLVYRLVYYQDWFFIFKYFTSTWQIGINYDPKAPIRASK